MASLQAWLRRFWRHRTPLNWLLLPAAVLYGLAMRARASLYRRGWLRVHHLPVPVVIAGGLTAGGGGKTTLAIALIAGLRARGWTPGLVARGYRGTARRPCMVGPEATAAQVGDEPLLVRNACQVPVAVGADRPAAAKLLLERHPDIDVIVSDDGLQHLALGRNVELAVCSASYRLGNRWPLPAGPLREFAAKAEAVDELIYKGGGGALRLADPQLLTADGGRLPIVELGAKQVAAVAGIAEPEEFFAALRAAGIKPATLTTFADHHRYTPSDLRAIAGDLLVMTSKDAIKCKALGDPRVCEFVSRPELDARLLDRIASRVRRSEPA